MAQGSSLGALQAVERVLASEQADVVRESVAVMVREIMEAEVGPAWGAWSSASEPWGAWRPSAMGIGTAGGIPGSVRSSCRSQNSGRAVIGCRSWSRADALSRRGFVNGVSTRNVDRRVEQMGLTRRS